jgi:hypothetical protein
VEEQRPQVNTADRRTRDGGENHGYLDITLSEYHERQSPGRRPRRLGVSRPQRYSRIDRSNLDPHILTCQEWNIQLLACQKWNVR